MIKKKVIDKMKKIGRYFSAFNLLQMWSKIKLSGNQNH